MNHEKIFISICIPAYKRVHYLKRLLDSISIQTYRYFEVVISDDSNDDSVEILLKDYENKFPLRYYRNKPSLGTPANWNFAITKATGEWIKLIHDDDWFTTNDALSIFADHTKKGNKFIFSAYTNVFEEGKSETVFMLSSWKQKILKEPNVLLAKNVVGPPSVTLIHKSILQRYDERLKWRVDMEYYLRLLQQERSYTYINKPLVNVGISESQVTQSCIYVPEVELPEGFILLQKQGIKALKNIWVYDAWWRLLRNMHITSEEQLEKYVPEDWPKVIVEMTTDLARVPKSLLKTGVTSKLLMSLSYIKNSLF
jgi:glycosyltransferase involved in cell wall biosynthesis